MVCGLLKPLLWLYRATNCRTPELTRNIPNYLPGSAHEAAMSDGIMATRLLTHKVDVDKINNEQLASLPGKAVSIRS